MTQMNRCLLCAGILMIGLAAQGELKRLNQTERPSLRRDLESIPLELGDWVGQKEDVAPDIVERAQTTAYLNRVYESRTQPGLRLTLWINYSEKGTNLRHTPEICLPSGGWTKIESQTKVLNVLAPNDKVVRITRLGYGRGELVEQVGFWYYIFGEGKLENFVRQLPITSRSSHGQTTRGSSMTVEIFYPGEHDPDGDALRDFAQALLIALEPVLPHDRAEYYVP
ncbi:MAG: EpsI family protein [Isosphaeraceae bacterium]